MASAHSNNNIPLPHPLQLSGNIASNWKRFKGQWSNYETATELEAESMKKRTAIFLTCIGNEAYDVYEAMQFAEDAHRTDIDRVIEAFEQYCIGEVNVTYERYVLNK